MFWGPPLRAGQAVAITTHDINGLAIRSRHDAVDIVFIPIGGIAGDPGKFKERLRLVEIVIAVRIPNAQDRFRTQIVFRMISVLHEIEVTVDKRHSLRVPPLVRDHLHLSLSATANTGRRVSKQSWSLIRRIDSSHGVETHGHPRAISPWHGMYALYREALMDLDC